MTKNQLIWTLKICSFFIFFGRAYEHLFWDSPFRALLWDQQMIEGIVENIFNTPWNEYVTSNKTDAFIQNTIRINGLFYAVCAAMSLIINIDSNKYIKYLLNLGGVSLILLSFLLSKTKFFHVAMFFEHAIQFGVPFVLLYLIKTKNNFSKIVLPLKILTALTFTSHGLYAIGIVYPLPGQFVAMTLTTLPLTEDIAKQFLLSAGLLDFLAVLFMFIPRLQKIGMLYAFFWGTATAFARILTGLSYDISFSILHQYLYATIYRIPHGLIPLILYYFIKNSSAKKVF